MKEGLTKLEDTLKLKDKCRVLERDRPLTGGTVAPSWKVRRIKVWGDGTPVPGTAPMTRALRKEMGAVSLTNV